jgi:hypothetical protein
MRTLPVTLLVVALTTTAAAGRLPSDPQLVLDIREGSFRLCMGWKTPSLVTADGKRKPLHWPKGRDGKDPGPIPVARSWTPPENWTQVEYDDTYWPRTRGPVLIPQSARFGELWKPGNPAEWGLVCLRARFVVKDPTKVMMPKFVLRYYGGAVVYVNGKELQRGHLPKGKIDFWALADPYPIEAYVRPDGRLYGLEDARNREFLDRLAKRVRSIPPKGWLDAVAIPQAMLRKGVNVIAVEVHAAPVHEAQVTAKVAPDGWKEGPCMWPHAGVVECKLTTTASSGLEANVAPSPGIRISTCHPWETLYAFDYSHPFDELKPLSLVGARNGRFSARILVSSREAIRGLAVTSSALAHDGGGELPAEAVRIRYAEPANPRGRESVGWRRWPHFDRLLDTVPDEVRATPMKIRGRNLQPVPTALVPVWVTVRVPPDAAPGSYAGKVTVRAEGFGPLDVPVRLKVHDWRIPAPKDFRLSSNIYQSPASVALYYDVPMWSDKHFELMAKSFEVLAGVGSRIVVVPLIIRAPNINNPEAMVRWIRQPDGSYKYDFSLMERYLDLYEKTVGKPRVLAIYHGGFEGRKNEAKPPKTTLLNPKTGELGEVQVPPYATDENRKFWVPVFAELRKRLETRGWYDVALVGHVSYCWAPTKETCEIYKSMWSDGKWISSCHGYRSNFHGMPVLCNEWIWGSGRLYNPDGLRSQGRSYPSPWRKRRAGQPILDLKIPRGALRDHHPVPAYRAGPEGMMQHDLHGFGRLGGDFWPVRRGKTGRRVHLCDRGCALGHAINVISFISPGPDGAVCNERVEAFRGGTQVAEAVAWLREMQVQNKVTGELAGRVEAFLDLRARHYVRVGYQTSQHWRAFASCGRADLNDRLYALAAEVSKAIGAGK